MSPALAAGTTVSAETKRLSYSHSSVTSMYRLAVLNFWSVKSEWLKTKPEFHSPLAVQILSQPPPKQPPESYGSSAG